MNTITDDQIAEIEALANDAAPASPFDWAPDIGMTHAETVYACAVGPDSILGLITRLREAERDAARYRWILNHYLEFHGDRTLAAMAFPAVGLDAAIDAAMMSARVAAE